MRFGDLDKANEQIKQLGEIKFARDESEKNLNNAKRAENVRQFITDCELSQKELQKRKSEYEVFVNEEAKLLKEADDALILLNNHIELEKEVTENKKSQAKLEAKKDDYSSIESLICEAEKLESEYTKLNKLCETDKLDRGC